MRAIRMGDELERRLQAAAAAAGESVSEFVRRATAARVDIVLRDDVRIEFADVIGAARGGDVHGGRGQARATGKAFADLVAAQATPRRQSRGVRNTTDASVDEPGAASDTSGTSAAARTA